MPEADDPPLATIAARVGARTIDVLLLGLVSFVLVVTTGSVDLDAGTVDVPTWARWAPFVAAVAYEILLVNADGRTLGKRAAGIRVVDAATGAHPNLDQAVRRALPALLNVVPYVGWLSIVSYTSATWRKRRQGWHDSLAGTLVVTDR